MEKPDSPYLPPKDLPANAGGPLSWRDVYAAVEASETRVLGAITALRGELSKATDDHEQRVRVLESIVVTRPEFDSLERRVGKNEDTIQGFTARENGITGLLKSQRDAILLVIAIITVAVILFVERA